MANNSEYYVKLSAQDNVSNTLNELRENFKKTGKTGKTELEEIADKFHKIESSSAPVKKKLLELQRTMSEMNLKGLDNTELFTHMAIKAGEYKDAISDASTQVKILSSDHLHLDTAVAGLQALGGAAQLAAGAYVALGGSEKDAQKWTAKLMALQSAMNGVQTLANALNKDSVLVQGLKAIAARTATTATIAETTATEGATVAQKAFNLACKSNPYVLLATVAATAVLGIIGFVTATNEATEAEEKAQRQAEELKRKQEDLRKKQEELSTVSATAQHKFLLLSEQWKQLKTTAEKNQFLKDNQSAFEALGLSVYNLKTAEDVFVNNTDAVVSAIIARAVAAKKAEQAAEDLIKLQKKRDEKSVDSGDYYQTAHLWDDVSDEEAKAAGVRTNVKGQLMGDPDDAEYGKKQVEKLNAYRAQQARERKEALKKQYDEEEKIIRQGVQNAVKAEMDAQEQLKKLGDTPQNNPFSNGGKNNGNNGNGNNGSSNAKSYADIQKGYEDELAEIEKKLVHGYIDELEAIKQKASATTKYVDSLYDNGKISEEESNKLKSLIDSYNDQIKAIEQQNAFAKEISHAQQTYSASMIQLSDKEKQGILTQEEAQSKHISALESVVDAYITQASQLGGIEKLNEAQRSALEGYVSQLKEAKNTLKYEDLAKSLKEFRDDIAEQRKSIMKDATKTGYEPLTTGEGKHSERAGQLNDKLVQLIELREKVTLDFEKKKSDFETQGLVMPPLEKSKFDNSIAEISGDIKKVKDELDSIKPQVLVELKVQGIQDCINGLSTINNYFLQIANIGNAWESAENAGNEAAEVFTKLGIIIGVVTGAFETFNAIMTIVNTIQGIMAAKTTATGVAQTTTTSAYIAETPAYVAAEAARTAASHEATSALLGEAAAGYMAAHAYIPFAGFGIAEGFAQGAIATVLGAQLAGAFAEGGIVGGGSNHGDRLFARVNSHEMILNGSQQKKLFDLLDSNGAVGGMGINSGNVTFKIQGKELVGVLNNFNTKKSKIW